MGMSQNPLFPGGANTIPGWTTILERSQRHLFGAPLIIFVESDNSDTNLSAEIGNQIVSLKRWEGRRNLN